MTNNPQTGEKRAILKSTTLLGGSSLVTILIGMVRTKFVAILLGPDGVGFMGVLSGLRDIVVSLTGLGLTSSGVRQVAHAVGKQDDSAIAVTVNALRTLVFFTGGLGLAVMVLGSGILSQISFKTGEHATAISFLGCAVFLTAISLGQSTVLQGFRRIGDVAKINIIGAVSGTIFGVPCYYFWGIKGVIPSLIVGSITSLAASWWFARKIRIPRMPLSFQSIRKEGGRLISFGIPLMLSGLISTGSVYFIRIFLTRTAGLGAVGQYQAAFNLALVLVNFVLGAMGTDYYPRLTSVSNDNAKMKLEVNSQTEISLLLSVPALAATVVFMPVVVSLFYSSKFNEAIPILRFAIFGVLGRLISWPMGFILLAKARGGLFFATELVSGLINVLLVIVCYHFFGLPGAGIAFGLLYLWYNALMIVVSKKIANVSWSWSNLRLVLISLAMLVFLSLVQTTALPAVARYAIGLLSLALITYFYLRKLFRNTGVTIGSFMNKIKTKREKADANALK